ncbi:FMR1-interacting protein NUFIP1 [Eurosta solidaginis]|uniref:FMR1-interacting protein NUFIP1 n=1 Tax=Eurosta solidaginis TaxID=178769 RepID=UPI003530E148
MASPQKFLLPSPSFLKKSQSPPTAKPHFLTPSGMTLHARHQPPPMYGKRGAPYPGKFLKNTHNNNRSAKFETSSATEPANNNGGQYCEACDMELLSMDDLRRHKSQHEKCPVDTCNYRGHPSVMDNHVTNLHNSGLFDSTKRLSTPEEIAAWREERRRRYPTVENTIMRQKAKEQREKRGERLGGNKSRFGKYEDRKRAQDNTKRTSRSQNEKPIQNTRHHKNNMHNNHHNTKRRKREEQQKLEEKKQNEKIAKIKFVNPESDSKNVVREREEEQRSCGGVKMFEGTSTLVGYQHLKPKKVKETNVLSSLLGMYGSDEDSEGDDSENEASENGGNDDSTIENTNTKTSDVKSASSCSQMLEALVHNETLEKQTHGKLINDVTSKEPISTSESDHVTSPIEHTVESNVDALASNIYKNDEDIDNGDPDAPTEAISSLKIDKKSEGNREPIFSDDEAPDEAPIARSSDIPTPTKRTQPIKNNEASTSDLAPAVKRSKTDQLARCRQQKSGLDYRKARLRKQNTLLEKLLEPEIRHERNVLLQCVRYVCENKFFGIGEQD